MKHCREVLKMSVSMSRSSWCSQVRSSFRVVRLSSSRVSRVSLSRSSSSSPRRPSRQDRTRCCILLSALIQLLLTLLIMDCLFPMVLQGQQISVQGQQVAQTADGQTIVYQPVNADGTVLQQGKLNFLLLPFSLGFFCFLDLKTALPLCVCRNDHHPRCQLGRGPDCAGWGHQHQHDQQQPRHCDRHPARLW